MDQRALEHLRTLAAQDEELERQAIRLRELDRDVAGIRAAADAVDAFYAAYPEQEAARRRALQDAEAELGRRRSELRDAEATIAAAQDDVSRAHAQHAVDRARDHVDVAEARVVRVRGARDELEQDAATLPGTLFELEARAAATANDVPGVPEPSSGLRPLGDWASHAHAALFVAAGQIDTVRERLIREANELASMLLGEPTYGATVAQALARVETHWTSSPGHVSESR